MFFEAGPVTFMRTILIIVIVYYGLKYLLKFLFPIFVKKFIQRQQDKFQGANNENTDSPNQTPPQKAAPAKKDDLGDYVEYEEVD